MSFLEKLEIHCRIDELQNRYILALDNKDMHGWLATFAKRDDVSYACITAENDANDWSIALMLDDCRARLEDRIIFVNQIWKGTFQDYRTRHFTQRLSCDRQAEGSYRVRSNFVIEYTFDPDPTQVLAAGVYEDVVLLDDRDAYFLSKRAVYDTTVLPQYIVYPF